MSPNIKRGGKSTKSGWIKIMGGESIATAMQKAITCPIKARN
jgi:hypothetical protein